ncbi:serine/threonine-protein kinase ATG1-like isoform X2 [Varroa jacobsoni]|uniref:serine/threonine-protein kinase ATG1-like isoform X2 n=1 Tax=Varroa jacobsoni TaxID=62625 RepID=UPI000BF789A8|nr:serine/threonine-protein kinase ATG1-like isoform X2 [Varroa jacobsoni]
MAVEHFHFCGLIHRDIKLSNIMILHNARVKLIDFDVSKICIAHFSRIYSLSYFRRTYAEFRVSEKIGTAAYMAPELHLGQRFGRAIDWWSLGVVGYRLFLGRLPFRGTTEKMVDQITNQNLNWSSNTSKVPGMKDSKARCIKEFLASILHKSPLHRLGSRSYDDIFGHEVFLGLEWEKLSRKNFDCPPLKELVGQESSGGNRVYEENAVMDGARMKQGRRLKPPAFQELEDIPNVQHVKLYTFISATIKNLVSKKGGTSDFLDEPPSVRHITKLCRRSIGEDSLSGEVGQTCELARTNPDTVKFVCDMHRKRFCPYQRTPVLFEQMPGYDGQQKLVVRKVNHPALISTLYEGDVIARIAGADSALWDSHSAESLFSIQSCVPIEVIADNAFRFATTSSLAVDDLQTRYGIISVDFVQAGKIGDVILSVNEVVEVDACLRVLRGNRELKNVKAVPCSPLRNPLINTITPPDYRERS